MNIHEEVNLIIFRIPDDTDPESRETDWDDGFRLVEIPYLGGKLINTGTIFIPHLHDESYRSIDFDRIVLARTTAESSKELMRYQVIPDKNGPDQICKLSYDELVEAVELVVRQYNAEKADS